MINQSIIEEVMLSPLMVDGKYLQALAVSAFASFSSNKPLQNLRYEAAYAIDPKTGAKQDKNFSKGSVGMVVIDGPIVSGSDDENGLKGTLQAAQELQAMDNDPNICGTVLYIESGGGAVYALKPIIDVMCNLTKPVVSFSKQILASAAYRIAAECNYIMMYHPQGIVGSIGTMSQMSDMQPMFEKWGMKFFEYYATESTLKNKTFKDARSGDGSALIKNILDPMNELFMADIKRLRPNATSENIYKGETYMADPKGIKKGLIDGIGSLGDAVQKVVSLSKSNNPVNKKIDTNMKFTNILALAGKANPTQEELDAANAELTEANITGVSLFPDSIATDAEGVTGKLATATEQVATLTTQLGNIKTELATEKASVVSLQEKLAKAPAVVAPATTTTEVKTQLTAEEAQQKEIDELPHNKALAGNPLFNKPNKN